MAKALNVSLAVTADTGQAKAQLQALQRTLSELTSTSANLKVGLDTSQLQQASQQITQLQAHLKSATNMDTGTLNFAKLNQSITSSGQSLEAYGKTLISLGPKGQQAFMQLTQSIAKSEIPIRRLSSLLGNFGTVLKNTIRWQLSSSMIHGFMGAIQSAYGYAQDLNKSLNNIQIVTQMSDNQMTKFAKSANTAAKALSTTTTKYTDAALIYYQQGIRDEKEIADRTNTTIKMANVTGQSAQEVSNQMTAIWNNFAKGGENLEYYADVITALGAATASSSAEISTGLQKFAAIADTVGLSYENATAALATITATTRQSADTVGTGLRTVFSRLQSLSLGETLDDGVTLTKYSKAMQKIGVDILDASGNLRQMDDILMDMGQKWQDLTDAQKTATAQTIGGVRQYTTIMALMDNFDFYKSNLDIAKNSEGTLQQQQEIYEKSWEAASKRMRASAETIYSALLNDQFFIKLTDNFAKILNFINQFISGLGGVKGLLLSLGSIAQGVFGRQIATNLYKTAIGVKSIFTNQEAARNNFISNAATMMAGAIPGGKMSTIQQEQANGLSEYLKYQQMYRTNVDFMTPEQRMSAQMALDNYFDSLGQQRQAQGKVESTGLDAAYARATVVADSRESVKQDFASSWMGQEYAKAQSLIEKYNRGEKLSKAEDTLLTNQYAKYLKAPLSPATRMAGTKLQMKDQSEVQFDPTTLKKTFDEYEAAEAKHAKEMAELHKEAESLEGEDKKLKLDEIAERSAAFDKERESYQTRLTNLGVAEETAKDYVKKVKAGEEAKEEKESINKEVEQKRLTAQKLSEQNNRGMEIATGVQKAAMGITSSLAVSTGIEGMVSSIEAYNDGASTASELTQQLMGSIGSIGMNGVMAFTSMTSAVKLFGKGLGIASKSAGWIGAILTAITIALPFIIKGIDGLVETQEERIERLNDNVELAQEDLQKAKQKYQEVFTDFKGHNALLDELNNLTEGTYAFKAALGEANTAAKELIEKYKISSDQYYVDRRGAIRFSGNIEDQVATKQEQEIAKAEYNLHSAELGRDIAVTQQKMQPLIDKATEWANEWDTRLQYAQSGKVRYQQYSEDTYRLEDDGSISTLTRWGNYYPGSPHKGQTSKEMVGMYASWLNKEQYADFEKIVKKAGFESVEDFGEKYIANRTETERQLASTTQATQTYRQYQEDRAKLNDGMISDTEQLRIDALTENFNPLDKNISYTDKTVDVKMADGSTKTIHLDTYNDYEDRLNRYAQYLRNQEDLTEAEADQIIDDMVSSSEWQGLTDEQRSRRINAAIQQRETERLIKEADENNPLAQAFDKVDLSKYENRSQMSANDIWQVYQDAVTAAAGDADLIEAERLVAEQALKQQADATANLQRSVLSQTNLNLKEDDFTRIGANLSSEQLDALSTYTNMFGQMFGADTAGYIFSELLTEMKDGGSDLLDALDNIDWSDSNIDNLFSLQTAIDNLGKNQPELKQQLRNTANLIYDSIGGSAGLLEELYGSDGFADTLEDLKETFEETGEISAESILSASKGCKQLSKFLDITEVNAQGLADVLESIEIGDIGIDQVTDGLLQAMSAAGALEANLAGVYEHIDNFKLDRSISDIGKFYKGLADQVEDSQGAGMLFDKPLLQSWQELFGKKSLDAYKEWANGATDRKNWTPQQISDDFNKQFAAEIAAMQSIQERGNLSGMFEYAFNRAGQTNNGKIRNFKSDEGKTYQTSANESGQISTMWQGAETALMHFDETTGQVVTDNDEAFQAMFSSQAEFIDYLSNNLDVPREMAEAMAAEFAATDAWAHDTWGADAAKDGFDKLVQSLNDGNDLTIDALEAFYNQYKEFLDDKDFDAFAERFKKATEKAKGSLIDLGDNFDYTTGKYQDLADAMGEEELASYLDKHAKERSWFGDKNGNGKKDEGEEDLGKARDVNQLVEAYEKLGYTSAQANAVIADSGQVMSATYHTANDGLKTFLSTDQKYLDWATKQYGITEEQARSSAEAVLGYQEMLNHQAQTEVDANVYAEAFANALTDVPINFNADNLASVVATAQASAGEVTIPVKWGDPGPLPDGTQTASGYNNAKGFAGGKHSNGQYEGLADVGELGPELFIHDGQPYLAGVHGRTRAYVHKDDSIYTAAETKQILEENPSLQDIPGFSVGYNRVTWGRKGTGANAGNAKTSKYEPERYHLITRQLKDLQREYDRLDKIKENCYGTNKLEAIQREIDATNELIKGQKELVKEAEDYLKIDAGRLKELLGAGEFQIDENGNLLNFEALQEKYRKKAEEDKDEHAQDVWKALQQYEETLDKLQEANVEMQDLLYQEMELRLEKITTKVDMHIDFDDREIKLLDHYIKRIDDNIYHTAEVLALTEEKLGHINQKIEDTKEGIHELFAEMSDSEGNLITKADGTAYTLDEWLALTNEERDLLDINGQFGEQLEEYMDDLLDYIEELEEFKTKGVEEFADAFSELNDNVRSSIDLFDHYNQLLSSLKNITDLQGIKLTAELKAARKEIDQIMFQNTQNNIQAEGNNYKRLVSEVEDLRRKIANTQDETLKKAWEEQLKAAEEELRTSEQNMLTLWETGLQQAKDMFEQALQDAVDIYETTIAGMYGTVDELEKAWDQQKKNDDFYVKDFEKYYQIQKLQRSITKDLDTAARAGNKQNQGLKKLYDDLNAAREDGVELSAYDLDIYAKRYEYEKALMELEDARNNKNEVRLQRDANGNWGYVYTSAADEDDLIAKQQAVDDKFYELQKATQERVASLSDDLMSEITGVGKRLQELHSSGASQDTIKKYLEQEKLYLENYEKGLAKALEDAGMTEEEARNRYGNTGFDILNDFQETLFSAITGGDEGLDKFFKRVSDAVTTADAGMVKAGSEYQKQVSAIDKWFNESGEDLAKVIKGFATLVGEESSGTLLDSKEQIDNAKQTFTDILQVARDFEQEFMTIYQPIIDANEQLVADLLEALHALNREEYEGPDHSSNPDTSIGDIIGGDGSSSEGSSGSGGSGSGDSGNDKVFSKYSDWETNDNKHWRYAIYTDGSKYKTDEGYHQWVKDAGDHWEDDKHYNSRTCQICKKRKWWYSYRGEGGTGGGCFEAGTQIIMADNSIKNIEDIKVNDYVYAYNEQTGLFEIHQVIKSYVHHNTPRVISVIFSNGLVLNMTPGHPILTTEGWKSRDIENSLIEHNTIATWLNIGDTIINISNDIIQIVDIQEKNIPDNFDTYNIEVETCHTFLVNGLVVHNAKNNLVMERMATGGYTGAWGPEGRMAILDEKELVLNKDDTKNFLNATTILRTLDLQTGLFSKGLGSIITPLIANMQQGTLDQNVHIDATFPNVTDHSEIEAAFDNLINKASQYANRKNMSSMTFNDMYISKF